MGRPQVHGWTARRWIVVLVRVEAPIRPSEDALRVEQAARRLFPDLDLSVGTDRVTGTCHDLRALRSRVWELRIIDTFRGQFLHGAPTMSARSTTFRLSKQAALAGKVSFPPTPHPLGDLQVTVELEASDPWKDVEQLGSWMCPETKDGEIVGPSLP